MRLKKKSLELEVLINVCRLYVHTGEYKKLFEYGNRALTLAKSLQTKIFEAEVLICLAYGYEKENNNTDIAIDYFTQSLKIREELEQYPLLCEPLAGIAGIYYIQKDSQKAMEYVVKTIEALQNSLPEKFADPYKPYLTCYKVLKDIKPDQSVSILSNAYGLLIKRAETITCSDIKESFLHNVKSNHEIITYYKALKIYSSKKRLYG